MPTKYRIWTSTGEAKTVEGEKAELVVEINGEIQKVIIVGGFEIDLEGCKLKKVVVKSAKGKPTQFDDPAGFTVIMDDKNTWG